MKNLWKTLRIAVVGLFLFGNYAASSAEKNENLEDLSFAELINSVELGKQTDLIKNFQAKEAQNVILKNKNIGENSPCTIHTIRNSEVIVVTIPASELFGPNKTDLLENASKYLEPFKRYFKEPDMYRVLVVMHTDNTGSEAYREKITIERAEAVADWFENNVEDTTFLFPFAMADDMPLKDNLNDSFSNRAKNRRLEIYLVPGETMVEKAKKGRIAF